MKSFLNALLKKGSLFTFIGAKALTSLLPLISIPLLINTVGYDYWVRIATIQVIAAFLSLFIESKWASLTQAEINKNVSSNQLLTNVFIQKMLTYLALNLLIVFAWLSFASQFKFEIILFLSMQPILTAPFSNGWYWLIISKPNQFLQFEVVPKLIAGVTSLVFLFHTRNLNTFFILLAILQILSSKLGFRFVWGHLDMLIPFRAQMNFAVSRAFQSIYSLLTLPLVSLLSPLSTGMIAANDRIYRFSMTALIPFQQSYVSTVSTKKEGLYRFRKNLLIQVVLLSISILGLSSDLMNNLLFEGKNTAGHVVYAYFVLGVFVILNRGLISLYLVSRLGINEASLPNTQYRSGLLVLMLIVPMNHFFGYMGILITFVLAEALVSIGYILVLRNSEESWRENE